MTTASWLQLCALLIALAFSVPLLGRYLARVFDGEPAPGDRVFDPVERLLYRLTGADPDREQRWPTYATSLLAFSAVSVLALYALQRFQGSLPFNPTGADGVPPALAFNTAVSFVTNTNWQNYAGENTMSHLTQMVGLAVQNFVSAAVGPAIGTAGGDPDDPTQVASGASNLGPTNPDLLAAVTEAADAYRETNGLDADTPVPVDAVTGSGSGLDPHISVANAELQAPRVADERGLGLEAVLALIDEHTDGRSLGFLGEPGVNVLHLNLALDAAA